MTDIKKKRSTATKAANRLKLNKETLKDLTAGDGGRVKGGQATGHTEYCSEGCSQKCTDRYHCC